MKRNSLRVVVAALVLGFSVGILSWLMGQQLMAYKPFEDKSLIVQDPILTAFNGTGARFGELNFIGWAQINRQYLPDEKIISLAKEVADNFGSLEKYAIKVENDKDWRQVKLEKPNINIFVQSRSSINAAKAGTYCSIKITSNSLENYRVLKRQFEKSLESVDENSKGLTTIITGWYPGTMTAKGMKNIANKTLALAGAKIIEGIGEKNFLSISAYTPQIKNKIRINDRDINLNVALRANSVDGKTFFYIGSPIIAREY